MAELVDNIGDFRRKVAEELAPALREIASADAKAKAPRRSTKDPLAAERASWEELSPSLSRERAVDYKMDGTYRVKEQIAHPLFGLGVVQRVVSSKIDVLFKDGKKLLCSR